MKNQSGKGEKILFLCYDEELPHFDGNAVGIGEKSDFDKQAKRLFAALREADASDVDIIYAPLPPQKGMGLALFNRLIRAAAHQIIKI